MIGVTMIKSLKVRILPFALLGTLVIAGCTPEKPVLTNRTAGGLPVYSDSSDGSLWVNLNGAWKKCTATSVSADASARRPTASPCERAAENLRNEEAARREREAQASRERDNDDDGGGGRGAVEDG